MTNEVELNGRVLTEPEYSHSSHDEIFLKFYVGINRLSGVEDVIPVIVSKTTLEDVNEEIYIGMQVDIWGEYRSFSDEQRRLKLYVYAKQIWQTISLNGEYEINNIKLEGIIVIRKPSRITPMGKKIIDLIICVERGCQKRSYIPCLIWGKDEYQSQDVAIGKRIKIAGRIQSREYKKVYEDGKSEIKTAYEVSIKNYEVIY